MDLISGDMDEKNIFGSKFFVREPPKEYLKRITQWLGHVGMKDDFPKLEEAQVLELSDVLLKAGNQSVKGQASRSGHTVAQIANYTALLHEVTHTNPEYQNNIMSSEAGAFSLELIATGGYDSINRIIESGSYKDSLNIRIFTEASFIFGKKLPEYLGHLPRNISFPDLAEAVKQATRQLENDTKKMSAEQYLQEFHSLPKEIAQSLLEESGHHDKSIIGGTDETKKRFISAYKTLTSFFSINAGISIKEADRLSKTLFERGDALTTAQQVEEGMFNVISQAYESGFKEMFVKELVGRIISSGSEYARLYAKQLPKLINITANYGPQQEKILAKAFSNPALMFTLLEQNGVAVLEEVAQKHPDLKGPFLKHLLNDVNWKGLEFAQSDISVGSLDSAFKYHKFLPADVKTQLIAVSYMGNATGQKSVRVSSLIKELLGDKVNPLQLSDTKYQKRIVGDIRSKLKAELKRLGAKSLGFQLIGPRTEREIEGELGAYEVIKTVHLKYSSSDLKARDQARINRVPLEGQIGAYRELIVTSERKTNSQFGEFDRHIYFDGELTNIDDLVANPDVNIDFVLPSSNNPVFTNNPLDYIMNLSGGRYYDNSASCVLKGTKPNNGSGFNPRSFKLQFGISQEGLPEISAIYEVKSLKDDGTAMCIKYVPAKVDLLRENLPALRGK